MKTHLMFFIFVFLNINVFGQQNSLSGVYYSELGTKIEIKNGKFIYTEHQEHLPVWYNDTLAVCNLKQVGKQVWEISSLDSFYDIFRTMEIVPSYYKKQTDSIKVVFLFPYHLNDLRISIYVNNQTYSNKCDSLCVYIPRGTSKITFCISRKGGNVIHTVYGQSYGVRYIHSFEENIDSNADCITIKLPLFDNSFFEKYFIPREYIYIEEDTIHWKDMDFKRWSL